MGERLTLHDGSSVESPLGRTVVTVGPPTRDERAYPDMGEATRIRLALAASDLGTWSWDAGTDVVQWDETLERMFGFDPGTFDGTYAAYLQAIHPDDRDEVEATVRRSLSTGGEHRVEHRVIWPDGSLHRIEGWGRALLDDDGRTVGLVGVSHDVTERRRDEFRLRQLQDVTAALGRARTVKEVGRVTVEEMLTATDALATTLLLADHDNAEIRLVASSLPEAELDGWEEIDIDGPLIGAEAIRTGRSVVRPATEAQGPSTEVARIVGAGEATYVVALPLGPGDEVLGAVVMALGGFDANDEGSQKHLRTLAAQLGQALDRALRHERELLEAARTKLLADASSLLGRSLDSPQAIGQVALAAVPGFADWCIVELLDDHEELELLAVAHADPEKVELARRLRMEYPPDRDAPRGAPAVVRSGKSELMRTIPAELIEGVIREHPELEEVVRELRLTSSMTVPLIARGKVLGAMSLVWGESQRHYDDRDLIFAEELARRAAYAIDNARLYENERTVVDTLQASLRPPELPAIDDLELASAYRPGGAHGEVAGDFYDVFALKEGSWLAVIGDVCGKGVPAAAVMALARYTLRTAALSRIRPSTILATLNEALLRSGLDRYCTACAVRLDRPSQASAPFRLTVCAAGHPPPLVVGETGAGYVEARGALLGIFDEPTLEDVTLELDAGASLVLYTDGVTEQRHAGELFGDRRLLTVAEDLAGSDAESLTRGILEAVSSFRPGPPADDIAILALRAKP
jgi:PAS domain S-box-containing protein